MRKFLLLCGLILSPLFAFAQDAGDKPIHDELRGMLGGLTQAINARQYDKLAPFFHEKMRVTTINQEFLASHDEIAPYFNKWFGQGGYLKSLEMTLEADVETELHGDKSFGIARGKGMERYELADGRKFDMPTRWTATVIRDADGKWRILALHIGTNFLDNPLLSAVEGATVKVGVGGAIGGLVLGLLVGWLAWRRKRVG